MRKEILHAALLVPLITSGCNKSDQEGYHSNDPVIESVYESDGSRWPVACYGRQTVEAKPGDILLRLILNNTDIHQPSHVGRPDIPIGVIEQAVADLNGLDNPDRIIAGQEYNLPDYCQQQ